MRWLPCALSLVCMCLPGVERVCYAQGADPLAQITAAGPLTSLESANAKPWHLTMDVTVFDQKGENPQTGTVEVWHSGAEQRTVYTFGDRSSTVLVHDGKHYFHSTALLVPVEAYQVVAEDLHPGPNAYDLGGAVEEVHRETFGKVVMDCTMLSQPLKGVEAVPVGLYPTYCVDANGELRSTYNAAGRTVVLNKTGKFEDHEVPVQLDMLYNSIKVATAKTTVLTSYVPQPDEFVPSAEMKLTGDVARMSGEAVKGLRTSFVPPIYPSNMKANHQSGTVVFRCLLGVDGHVLALRLDPSAKPVDPELVISAIAAVSKWIYKPYLLNLEPTQIDTTISVNFVLN